MKVLVSTLAVTLACWGPSASLAATLAPSVWTIPATTERPEPDFFNDLYTGHASPRPADTAPEPRPVLQATLQVYLLIVAAGLIVNRLPSPQNWPQTELAAVERSRTRWTIARSPFER